MGMLLENDLKLTKISQQVWKGHNKNDYLVTPIPPDRRQ